MKIRLSQIEDIPAIMAIYDVARQFMKDQGNPTQWDGGYPSAGLIEDDIAADHSFVVEEEGRPVGTFAFIIGEDPTYQVIEKGAWHSNGQVRGLSRQVFDFCCQQIPYLRIDTHADNQPMQTAVLNYDFRECGIIYVEDGSPRLAYDYHQ